LCSYGAAPLRSQVGNSDEIVDTRSWHLLLKAASEKARIQRNEKFATVGQLEKL
jgi:hypothetical protein